MVTIQRFEDIEAWQRARQLTRNVYGMTNKGSFRKDYALQGQIRRAAVSIMCNIAEGFERGGNQEFAQFLAVAKGSAGEVRACLYTALDAEFINQEEFAELSQSAHEVSRLISGFMKYLKGSSIR
jgi:four helix bundle protein